MALRESESETAVNKAKKAITIRTAALHDIIISDFTTFANRCEEKEIIHANVKADLTSNMTNKSESQRTYGLLDAVRKSISVYNPNKPMNDFLCVIRDYGGPAGVAIVQEMAEECGCDLQSVSTELKSPDEVTTKAVKGNEHMTQPRQNLLSKQSQGACEENEETDDKEPMKKKISKMTDLGGPASVYSMNNNVRGLVLIINNEEWPGDPEKCRKGSSIDVDIIRTTFKYLKYMVEVEKNMTSLGMREYFENLNVSLGKDLTSSDCFICFIMSHGDKRGIEGTDEKFVRVKDLAECVQPDKCKSLIGKPKLFFIQACRGEKMPDDYRKDSAATPEDDSFVIDGQDIPSAIPTAADFFIGYSTVEDNVSLRKDKKGSPYIQVLCKNIDKYHKDCTLYNIMMLVHEELATNEENSMKSKDNPPHRYRQMAQIVSTHRKNFYF